MESDMVSISPELPEVPSTTVVVAVVWKMIKEHTLHSKKGNIIRQKIDIFLDPSILNPDIVFFRDLSSLNTNKLCLEGSEMFSSHTDHNRTVINNKSWVQDGRIQKKI